MRHRQEQRCPYVIPKTLVLLSVIVILLVIGYNSFIESVNDMYAPTLSSSERTAFLIYTPACKIPRVDPFDEQVKDILQQARTLNCPQHYEIVQQIGNKLVINKTIANNLRKFRGDLKCHYETVWRPIDTPTSHDFFEYTNQSEYFTSSIDLRKQDEFVRVSCLSENTRSIYNNFFTTVQRKDEVERRCRKNFKKNERKRDENLNVLMIGVESVSRINMLRFMNDTRNFLITNMSAVELLGYNKIADNTLPNIVPMLTGKYLEDLPWNETLKDIPFDKHDFMWNKFSRGGYRTFYAEDAPTIAIFDYEKAGFSRPSADYYNRHMSVAMEKEYSIWRFSQDCVYGRPETSFVLNYLKQFLVEFRNDPYFAFTFISRLTHDKLESAAMADNLYKTFFQEINLSNLLNRTVLFFFSDHGTRFGKVRETFVGKLEERMPFMFLLFPKWFLEQYPNIRRSIITNTQRLTTPFDIYATLTDLLHFKDERGNQKLGQSMSLLRDIPDTRTCDDIKMLSHWCLCADYENLDVSDSRAVSAATQMLTDLNTQLNQTSDPVCEYLHLYKIKSASRLVLPNKVLTFKRSDYEVINRTVTFGNRIDSYVDYQLTVETIPGHALFEGTVRYNERDETFTLIGEVSRINKYGFQSHCVDNSQLKKICYCKVQNT